MSVSDRSRTYTWEDPIGPRDGLTGLSGLEFLKSILEKNLPPPPMAMTLDFAVTEVAEGRAVFVGQPAEFHYNPIGVVHGGYAMTLLDSAMGCAVHSTLAAGDGYTTLESSVNFVRPITLETGRVRCEATVLHRGGRVATAEGRLIAENTGKLLAHGTTTCLVMKR
jgi:uncharacterized protein (TIGR00369 family)